MYIVGCFNKIIVLFNVNVGYKMIIVNLYLVSVCGNIVKYLLGFLGLIVVVFDVELSKMYYR